MSSKNKGKKIEVSDDSSEEVKPTKKVVPQQKRKTSVASESSSKKANLLKKNNKKPVESDSESDAPVKKAPAKKKVAAKKADSDDESNEVPAKKVAPAKKTAKQADSDSDSDQVAKKGKKPVGKKVESDSDEKSDTGKKNNDAEEDDGDDHKELFVKNLSYNTTEDSLWEYFGKFGKVEAVKLLTDRMTGRPKGIGFVSFSTRKEAKNALENAGDLDGRTPNLSWSNDKDGSRKTGGPQTSSGNGNYGGDRNNSGPVNTIFVGNLGFKTTEQSVKKFFSGCGNIVSVRIAKQEDGRAKGFCHVDFDSEEAVTKAVAMAGQELDGREIRVDKSEARKRDGFSRGGRGGDRGGFRGGRGGDRGGRGGRGGFSKPFVQMGQSGKKTTFDDSD